MKATSFQPLSRVPVPVPVLGLRSLQVPTRADPGPLRSKGARPADGMVPKPNAVIKSVELWPRLGCQLNEQHVAAVAAAAAAAAGGSFSWRYRI